MRRIAIVVNSRANYARIKSVIEAVNQHKDLELILVAGASSLLDEFGNVLPHLQTYPIVVKAFTLVRGDHPITMAKSAGLATMELATIWEHWKPDIVLTVADRFETIATAISASYMNITVAHTQGGELTGSIDESVRHAVTKLSHLHFTATQEARERVIAMGEDPLYVYNTGCPAIDLLMHLPVVEKLPEAGMGPPLDLTQPFLLVSQHPVTTEYPDGLAQIEETLQAVSALDIQTLWLWPNVDAGSGAIAKRLRQFYHHNNNRVHFYHNLPPEEYAALMQQCACMIGNSSSGIREGAFLGVPVVNIGSRQANRERGWNVMDVGCHRDEIQAAVRQQMKIRKTILPQPLYGDGHAGERIAQILANAPLRRQK